LILDIYKGVMMKYTQHCLDSCTSCHRAITNTCIYYWTYW